jgi:hypothetical protein
MRKAQGNSSFVAPKANGERLFAKENGYFDAIRAHPRVKTLYFHADLRNIRPLLPTKFYKPTGNDCAITNTRQYPSFVPKCQENLFHSVFYSHELQYDTLRLGLPEKYTLTKFDETLTYLQVIPDAIVTQEGDVITSDLFIVPHRCNSPFSFPEKAEVVYEEVFVAYQIYGEEYYHSMSESVPRLTPYVKFLNDNPNVRIFCRRLHPISSMFGIANFSSRVITEPNFGARVLYLPAGGTCGQVPMLTTTLAAYLTQHDLPHNPRARKTMILIRRSEIHWFGNHDAIAKMMAEEARAHSLNFYEFRDDPSPDFETTRRVFHDAIIIVAPHGAGEANILHSQPGTVLIEALCIPLRDCFQEASYYHGLRYYALYNPKDCFTITPDQIKDPLVFYLQHLKELYD